jgi:hypothetical protein
LSRLIISDDEICAKIANEIACVRYHVIQLLPKRAHIFSVLLLTGIVLGSALLFRSVQVVVFLQLFGRRIKREEFRADRVLSALIFELCVELFNGLSD